MYIYLMILFVQGCCIMKRAGRHLFLSQWICMTPHMTAMAGMSRQLVAGDTCIEASAALGTVPYTAPEVFDTGTPTQASDAYAFGILRKSFEQHPHGFGVLRLLLAVGTVTHRPGQIQQPVWPHFGGHGRAVSSRDREPGRVGM
jgi:hypothetical protein